MMLLRRFALPTLLLTGAAAAYDDFHYPTEEPREHAAAQAQLPRVLSAQHATTAAAHPPLIADGPLPHLPFGCPGGGGHATQAAVGSNITCGEVTWRVHAMWAEGATAGSEAGAQAVAVVETRFTRWSLLAFLSSGASPVLLRKAVGRLDGITQPWFNLTKAYLTAAAASLADLPSQLATNMTVDHEPDYPSMASTLCVRTPERVQSACPYSRGALDGAATSCLMPGGCCAPARRAPQRDTSAISHAADVVKFAVSYSGRVKCASTGVLKEGSNTGG
jgi:hypothetical protein